MENENEIQLLEEIEELRIRLHEAEETISAIRGGGVDAIVVSGLKGEQVFTLTGAERAYRVLIETMNEGAAGLNREGLIIYCNQRLSEMIKTPLEKVISAPMRQFIRASDLPVFDSLMGKGVQESGKGEVALINSDGAALPVLLSVSSMQRDNENICGITVTDLTAQKHIEGELRRHRDHFEELVKDRTSELETSNRLLLEEIVEHKKAEVVLRESEERFKQIAESSEEWIWEVNNDGLYTYASNVVEKILGYTPEEIVGKKHFYDFFPSDIKEQIKKETLAGFATKQKFIRFVNSNLHKNGGIIVMETSGAPILDSSGDLLGYRGIYVDITERKRSEEERQKLGQQFQQAQKLESLGILAGGIAHDFNNILSVIICNCSLLQQRPAMVAELVPEIDTAAQRAADLCRQMLIYAGKAQPVPTKFNVKTLVEEMVKMLKATINQNVTITLDLSTDIPPIKADASQIRQVVMNLIINASEAIGTEQGNITVTLAIAAIEADPNETAYLGKVIAPGSYIRLKVTDNGCGMDEGTKQRIFEPFYTTKFTGRGLGMSAVLGIIKAHNGALQLTSHIGFGTTFTVYLPVQSSEPFGDLLPVVSLMPWQGGGTVLLVEDEPQLILVAKALIQALGFSVIEAANGQVALELYQKNAKYITLVLTDIGMPVMDGYELIRELKLLNPALPIIVSSGFGDAEVTSRIRENIAGIVSKPYGFDQLREVLRGVVEKTVQ